MCVLKATFVFSQLWKRLNVDMSTIEKEYLPQRDFGLIHGFLKPPNNPHTPPREQIQKVRSCILFVCLYVHRCFVVFS